MSKKTFILSDSASLNSHGFKIDLAGLKLDRFKLNPVMLYNHDRSTTIGKWTNLRIEDGKLMADAEFDTDDEVGKEVAILNKFEKVVML